MGAEWGDLVMMQTVKKYFFAALFIPLLVGFKTPAAAQSFQEGVNRPGPAYQTFSVDGPRRCQKQCIDDGQCRAWVFIDVTRVDNCQLKSERPAAVRDQCCTSGVVAQ